MFLPMVKNNRIENTNLKIESFNRISSDPKYSFILPSNFTGDGMLSIRISFFTGVDELPCLPLGAPSSQRNIGANLYSFLGVVTQVVKGKVTIGSEFALIVEETFIIAFSPLSPDGSLSIEHVCQDLIYGQPSVGPKLHVLNVPGLISVSRKLVVRKGYILDFHLVDILCCKGSIVCQFHSVVGPVEDANPSIPIHKGSTNDSFGKTLCIFIIAPHHQIIQDIMVTLLLKFIM